MAGEFEEISENRRIVMSDHFADENGREISPKEANMVDWTEPVTITFDFSSNGAKRSELSLNQKAYSIRGTMIAYKAGRKCSISSKDT